MSAVRIPLVVEVIYYENGHFEPSSIIFDDISYNVDKVIRKGNYCPKNIGCLAPIEYTIMVEGQTKKIYFEEHTKKWFSVKQQ